MTAYVTKPLRRGDLLQAISKVLQAKPSQPSYLPESNMDDADRTLVLASR